MGAANARTDIFWIERALPGWVEVWVEAERRALFGGEPFPPPDWPDTGFSVTHGLRLVRFST